MMHTADIDLADAFLEVGCTPWSFLKNSSFSAKSFDFIGVLMTPGTPDTSWSGRKLNICTIMTPEERSAVSMTPQNQALRTQ